VSDDEATGSAWPAYSISVRCSNCGDEGTVVIRRGQRVADTECEVCGCYALKKDTFPMSTRCKLDADA
jgi:predicted nucleic acid-binding Zn ribbon protein